MVDLIKDHQRPVSRFGGERREHRGLSEESVIGEHAPEPLIEEWLRRSPPGWGEGYNCRTVTALPRRYPLIDEAGGGYDDKDSVDIAAEGQSRGTFKCKSGLACPGAHIYEDRLRGRQHNLGGFLLPLPQRTCGGSHTRGNAGHDLSFTDPFSAVARHAEHLKVVHGGCAAARPGEDVIAFHQVAWYLALAFGALPILAKPACGHLGGREVSSRIERGHFGCTA